MTAVDLVGDIGGTHARLALWRDGALRDVSIVKHRSLPSVEDAISQYLNAHGNARPQRCCLAVATPITSDTVTLTNGHWQLSRPALREAFGFDDATLVNDFTALAHALPQLRAEDMLQFGGDTPELGAPRALLGAGTGLGVSGLLESGEHPIALSGEGGHVSVPMGTEEDLHIVARLQSQFGRVSLERILSGDGLRNVHWALDPSESESIDQQPEASAISAAAQRGDSERAVRTLRAFTRLLGGFAGDLALIMGASGGVFIGGGIAAAVADSLDDWGLREAFEDKGRMRRIVKPMPLYVITNPHAGLIGAAATLPTQSKHPA